MLRYGAQVQRAEGWRMSNAENFPDFRASDLPEAVSLEEARNNRFTEAALERHKREGLLLAARARWAALCVVAVLLPYLNPNWEVLYYEALLVLVAVIGWVQLRVGRVGRSRTELLVLMLDIAVMVFVLVYPNPFSSTPHWPDMMGYRYEGFLYLFLILAFGTLSYSWRTIFAIGNWTAMMWIVAAVLMWQYGARSEDLGAAANAAFGHEPGLMNLFDPNSVQFDRRIQQIVVFLLVAAVLALTVRRFNRLLLSNAALERERANLSRYFSPTVVEQLSKNDEPLKETRTHDVAVMFVDIQGFTTFASNREPVEVITTLREFLGRMEQAVFAHDGTLDKFLGDGLMATFGTPFPRPDDVPRALACAQEMLDAAQAWNAARSARGEVPLHVSVGLHVGPVVLGDIGGNRLEFAVIGSTVNMASRLEAMTRELEARLVISHAVYRALPPEQVKSFDSHPDQAIRGIAGAHCVWSRT